MFLPNHFKTNPFDKHIFKLEQIRQMISERKTVGGLSIEHAFTLADRQCLEQSIQLMDSAIRELKKMDKKKELLR